MNSKERVRRAVGRQETDRVPISTFGTGPDMVKRISKELNLSNEEEFNIRSGVDIREFHPLKYIGPTRFFSGIEADYWGVPLKSKKENKSDNDDLRPFANVTSVKEVEEYNWPDINDFVPIDDLEDMFELYKDYAIIGGVWAPVFHNMTWMCGFENALVLLSIEPEISKAILSRISDFWIAYTKKTLELGKGRIDIIQNCNDFGTQINTIMNPEIFRKYFKPIFKRLYDVIKNHDAFVFQHSCGAIREIIPDLIEIGADILNPVQVNAEGMDIDRIKNDFGKDITLCGGIDTQHLLPEGSEEDVRREVRRVIDLFKGDGGYILCGSQGLDKDIPVKNIAAMFDECMGIV